jgi:Phage tail assembly chaperone protein, TAC
MDCPRQSKSSPGDWTTRNWVGVGRSGMGLADDMSSVLNPPPLAPALKGRGLTETAIRLAGLTAVHLGWTPDIFWAATPAELAEVLAAFTPDTGTALSSPDLATLMEQFPDG